MEINSGKTYARVADLVTTTDGKCPEGYIEVESVLVLGGLYEALRQSNEKVHRLTEYWIKEREDFESAQQLIARIQSESDARLRDLARVQGDFNMLANAHGRLLDEKARAEKAAQVPTAAPASIGIVKRKAPKKKAKGKKR